MARISHRGFLASARGLDEVGRLKRCVAVVESIDEAMGVLGW